jgi:serine/threonine-protein kinase
MSRVFEARHIYLAQLVALKTTLACAPEDAEYAQRFLREAKTLASMTHPNVIRVFDANVWEEIPYVVTERLQGRTVSQELKEFGRLTVERVLDLIEDVAAVFSRQEQLGILHRDIKPANLFMRPDGSTCVFDYGLVGFVNSAQAETSSGDVATKAGAMIGTMAYMAPEQVLSQETGPWTDIFALEG